MAFLLDRMAETGATVSELAAQLPRYTRLLGKAAFRHGRLGALIQELEESFPEAACDHTDGLKVILPGAWIHVRASNTEALLRIAVEARTQEEAGALYARVLALFDGQ
jgi:phosphomannomutase